MGVHVELFDPETVVVMRSALDDAWSSLPSKRQTLGRESALAAAIVMLAARGERDLVSLSRDALKTIATGAKGVTGSAGAQIKKAARRRNSLRWVAKAKESTVPSRARTELYAERARGRVCLDNQD